MAIDFKNIVFKFVKVTGGTPRIDADMTEKIFNSTKPLGVYRCFIFPKGYFGGYDYEDVQNLVDIEELNIWDRINRDTFLGFNEETNQFIVNYNAWLSLKDSDLKTDGELPHPSQAGWFVTTLLTSKNANSKFELNQTDGSKVYLSINQYQVTSGSYGSRILTSSACVENKLKSVLNSTLINKDDALFAKCADDNSVLMVDDCVKTVTVSIPGVEGGTSKLSRNNKEYGLTLSTSGNRFNTTYKYCKKILSFESNSSKNPITTAYTNVLSQNSSSTLDTECTHTDNFEDILASGESLILYTIPKARSFRFTYSKTLSGPFVDSILYQTTKSFYDYDKYSTPQTFSLYADKSIEGIPCDLVSCDARKPFVYEPQARNILTNGFNVAFQSLKTSDFIKNIPDGFIFLVNTKDSILRYKKGEAVKEKPSSSTTKKFVKITGTTQFGNSLFVDKGAVIDSIEISKSDVISGTGFSDISGNSIKLSSVISSLFFVTVLRV